jgi:hypothetical protein
MLQWKDKELSGLRISNETNVPSKILMLESEHKPAGCTACSSCFSCCCSTCRVVANLSGSNCNTALTTHHYHKDKLRKPARNCASPVSNFIIQTFLSTHKNVVPQKEILYTYRNRMPHLEPEMCVLRRMCT